MYSISLTIDGRTSVAKGDTMLDALTKLRKPDKIFIKGVVEISNGKRTELFPYNAPRIKRMFYPIVQKYLARDYEFLLNRA